jgi:hypothetical protein
MATWLQPVKNVAVPPTSPKSRITEVVTHPRGPEAAMRSAAGTEVCIVTAGMASVVQEKSSNGFVYVYVKESAQALGAAKNKAKTRQSTAPIAFTRLGVEVLILSRLLSRDGTVARLYGLRAQIAT